ncbi:MAG TPA: phosphohistidine phosphatase SixA [Candidatus Saccharimonadales bacterium]|nr:phosphohistidine phosphatase SixA [Candidatus Saccharimonadales bacterium]
MQLYIVRHGIAIDREDPKCPSDPERFLTEEGIEKTSEVAKGVSKIADTPELMLTSPYLRAAQTAEIFADALDYPKQKIRKTEALLPGAEPLQLMRELGKDKDQSTVFVFGHAPHVDELLATVLGSKHHISALKKAGVALVELRRLVPPSGQLVWLATSKLLRRAGK